MLTTVYCAESATLEPTEDGAYDLTVATTDGDRARVILPVHVAEGLVAAFQLVGDTMRYAGRQA